MCHEKNCFLSVLCSDLSNHFVWSVALRAYFTIDSGQLYGSGNVSFSRCSLCYGQNGNGQGLSTYFLFSLKKYGLVYQIGNYQGFPFYSVMDQDGNYTNIGTITDGFTSCFTATDPDHYYAIIEPQSSFHGLILGARFNNQVHLLDSFTTFIPTKIDFPSYYNGYMSIVEKADNTHKLLRSTDSISGWVTVYNSPLSEINDFQFYDDTIGYAIIGHQKVIRTLNGGEYWDTGKHQCHNQFQ